MSSSRLGHKRVTSASGKGAAPALMDIESIRSYCLSLPHATEDVKWGADLCVLIGGKMFAVASLEGASGARLSFKCTPEDFEQLIENDGIIPAPYMARNKWVALTRWDALPDREIRTLVRGSYDMVLSKLPKKVQSQLASEA
jgi:predicted DNA-binding protein (MmcQ/YjbR family)